jgi:hypothetical protein
MKTVSTVGKYLGMLVLLATIPCGCINPFAPRVDDSPPDAGFDQKTVEGVFQIFQSAYNTRDTTLYGRLLAPEFTFVYRDYDQGLDITWGRDIEMRYTYVMFQNTQRLDLIWNNIISSSTDSTRLNVLRGFNLTVTLNPTNVLQASGYANLTLERASDDDPWKIVIWRDQSNY